MDEVRQSGEVAEGSLWSFTTMLTGDCVPATMTSSVVIGTLGGERGQAYGMATVTILDNCGNGVVGADVSGHFTGDFGDSETQPTDATGVVVFVTGVQLKKPSFGFQVDDVVGGGLAY